jgi:transposase
MSRRHVISADEVISIEKARKKNTDKTIDRWLEVLLLHAAGKSRAEISEKTYFKKQHITELVCEYRREGLEEFAKKKNGGNNRNLSIAEEEALLEPFREAAASGQIVEVSAIKSAYEKAIGRSLKNCHSQIYNVLKRHGWRKVMPRSKHPNKASDEAIEASKKLTLESKS